jgi:tetratricopeptide (TPR) repeat protein
VKRHSSSGGAVPPAARAVAAAALLALLTALAFAPVWGNGFVNFDDNRTIFQNPRVRGGLAAGGVRWAFTNLEFENWMPLTWLSHQLDWSLFGPWAGGHHGVSALIHAGNAALLLLLLHAMTGALWPSAFAASLFALHPLRVESVAWASERKDVLMLLFALLALAAYLRWTRRRSPGAYAAALALYACALMSKAMVVTVPALLLLLDFWPLARWRRGGRLPLPPARLLLEKLPFLAAAAAASLVTFLAQSGGGAVAYVAAYPVAQRVPNAFRSWALYLWKTIWPAKLAVFYPYFWADVPWWQPALGAAIVAVATAGALLALRRRPALAVGWFWYLGALLPVIGIVQAGSQALADRYTYLPQIGLAVALAWGGSELLVRRPRLRPTLLAAALAALAALGAVTWVQAGHWRSTETLFRHALAVTENNFLAASILGAALSEQGRAAEGQALIAWAYKVNPDYRSRTLVRSGDYYAARGMKPEAAEQYRKALAISPWDQRLQEKLGDLGDPRTWGAAPPRGSRPGMPAGHP